MTVSLIPALPLIQLTADEQSLVNRLDQQRSVRLPHLDLLDAYFHGNQLVRDLGISIPPQVRGLHTVVGWPATAVERLDERLDVEGFRYASSSDGDDELWNIWQTNNLDEESQLAHLDAFIYGCAYAAIGANDDGSALITIESPRDVSVLWDARWREITAALRVYGGDEWGRNKQATLYLPDETVYLSSGAGGWDVLERDQHRLGVVPVARLANRQRTADRDGKSEITPIVMSITDAACRTLLGMEVAREFHAAPQRYLLGVSESAFRDGDGNAISAWKSYTGLVNAVERDEDGNIPSVWQAPAGDLSAYSKVMGELRQELSMATGLPPYMLGETTQNPASADAIRSAEQSLVKKAQRRQRTFSGGWETTMRLALQVQNGGTLPDGAALIETLWADAATPTPGATTDAMQKQVAAGIVPARSDVVRERLGYSVIDRQRLAIDDEKGMGDELLAQAAQSLVIKESRAAGTLVKDVGGDPGAKPAGQ